MEASELEFGVGPGIRGKVQTGTLNIEGGADMIVGTRWTGVEANQGHFVKGSLGYSASYGNVKSQLDATAASTWHPARGTIKTTPLDLKIKPSLHNISAGGDRIEFSGTFGFVHFGFVFDLNRYRKYLKNRK